MIYNADIFINKYLGYETVLYSLLVSVNSKIKHSKELFLKVLIEQFDMPVVLTE